jgi:hypothetical protein
MIATSVRMTVVGLALLLAGIGERTHAAEVAFTEHVITSGADEATAVFHADLDGDGDTDVIAASRLDDTLAWHENLGGTPPVFFERVISDVRDGAVGVHAADVDGDGDVDVLVASEEDDTIAYYANDGGSPLGFTERVISIMEDGASSVHAADVDGDGDMDILATSFLGDDVLFFESNGASTPLFVRRVLWSIADGAASVFAADLDADGDTDVLAASFEDDTVAWFENDGAKPAMFTRRVITDTADGAMSVHALDADCDGDVDVAAASFNDDTIAGYASDGGSPPVFTEFVFSTTADGASSVFVADVDQDGDGDVLAASFEDDTIRWFEGGEVLPLPEHVITTAADGAASVVAADVDGDGQIDVLAASENDDTIAWYESGNQPPGDIPFLKRTISTTADAAFSVFAADVDGDGDIDALSASMADDEIVWYENDGLVPAGFTEHLIYDLADGANSVHAADVDGDGDTDVIASSANDSTIAWFQNDGMASPGFVRHVVTLDAIDPRAVFAADMNGDGNMDILSASLADDRIVWYKNDGGTPTPGFTDHEISDTVDGAFSVFAADVDGDGRMDALSGSRFDNDVEWFWNLGGTTPGFDPFLVGRGAMFVRSVFAADMDGDGDVDVISASSLDDTVAWYENDGDDPPLLEDFPVHMIATDRDGAMSVFAIDVDRDGDIDVVTCSRLDDTVAWYESDGGSPPAFTEHVITTTADNARAVFAIDMDCDGDVDILSASENDDTIAWYEAGRTSIDFQPPLEAPAVDEATLEAVGNLDTATAPGPLGATPDVVVLIPDDDPAMPGQAQVFRNVAGDGDLVPNRPIPTGAQPSGVDVGDFNRDGFVDLVIVNATDDTVAVYANDQLGQAGFPAQSIVFSQADSEPRAVAVADYNGDDFLDMAVALDGDGTVRILFGDGSLIFRPGRPILGGSGMVSLRPGDVDDDKEPDIDFVVTSRDNNQVIVVLLEHGVFASSEPLDVGVAPVDLALGDLDGDGTLDIATADSGDATVSVLLNEGGGVFAERFTLATGTNPRSVHAVDLDGDGDLDLAVVAMDPLIGPAVQVFENTIFGGGESVGPGPSSGAFFFADPHPVSVDAIPNFVTAADFNLDGLSDLVTANADPAGTGGSVTVLLRPEPESPCPDIDGSGAVDFTDLLEVLGMWGPCPGCPADLDGDDVVGFADLLLILATWGPCS